MIRFCVFVIAAGIGFDKSGAKQNKKFGSGKATLRFKSNGKAEIEMVCQKSLLLDFVVAINFVLKLMIILFNQLSKLIIILNEI